MDVFVDFDELFIRVLNGLGPTYLNISHALQAPTTPVTFEVLFEHLLSYEAQMKILVPLAPPASTPTTVVITLASPSLHRRSTNRGGWNHNRSQQSWSLPANPPQYQPTTPPLSSQHPAPPTQLEHNHYLRRCQLCGITRHSAQQCGYLSTSALASLPLALARAQCPTFPAPYAHTTIHYSNPSDSSD